MNTKEETGRPAVTIIVPVYRVAEFIETCAVSLFEQDFASIEYVFVDDASPDNSLATLRRVIERYPGRKKHIKIIENSGRLGAFQARQVGTLAATGEYIQYVDSDDWVEPNMVSLMYQTAKTQHADVVACDFYVEKKRKTVYFEQHHVNNADKLLAAFLHGQIAPSVWSRLIRRTICLSLYNQLRLYKRVNLAEDWLITLPLYCGPTKIAYVPQALYHYNKLNAGSLTTELSASLYDDKLFVLRFLYDFLEHKLSGEQRQWLHDRLALGVLNTAFLMQRKPDAALLRQFGFSFFRLWRTRLAVFSHKVVYSFYFLQMPWVPKLIQRLRLRAKQGLTE